MWYSHEWQERNGKPAVTRDAVFPIADPQYEPLAGQYLIKRGLSYELAQQNGWYASCHAGDQIPRLVIPAVRSDGKVYWQARALTSEVLPRYQSPPGSRGDAIVRVAPQHDWGDYAVVTEGPLDALAAAELGFDAFALMGNKPNDTILKHLLSWLHLKRRTYLIADSDALFEATQTTMWLRGRWPGRTYLWLPYPYKDLAAMPKAERAERLGKFAR